MKAYNLIAFLLIPLALSQAVSASDIRSSTGKAETAAIVSAATDYVKKNSGRNMEFRITIEDVSGDFARARVDPLKKETDPALVYLKRTGGKWEGLTIGTSFQNSDLKELGVPKNLWRWNHD
ncbi:MAG TPA: hypothetical protein VK747_13520 [Blastocatellia bacterium]|nr:hypothetical protein [Blastocatellia bacterium]